MSNTRSLTVLLFATTLTMLSGGCNDRQMMPWSTTVGEIGQYSRAYKVDAVAMTEDGSILVTSHSYAENKDANGKRTTVQTHYFLFTAEFIEQQVQDIRKHLEKRPDRARYATWHDGIIILRLRNGSDARILTEKTFPPSLKNTAPLERVPLIHGLYDDDIELAREHARSRKWDEQYILEQAERYSRERYGIRDDVTEYFVSYQHNDMTCWLRFNEGLYERHYTPGGVALQTLLIVPAAIGDVILYVPRGLLWGIAFAGTG